jgi:hypothetical protein
LAWAVARHRDGRHLHLLAFLGVGLAVTLALVGIDRLLIKPRPTELQPGNAPALIQVEGEHVPAPIDDPRPNQPAVPPWAKCATLAAWLHASDPDLHVVRPERSAYCYVIDAGVGNHHRRKHLRNSPRRGLGPFSNRSLGRG